MRKLLLATAAVVGASMATMGIAAAQVQSLQGDVATPANGNFASVYGDNNYMSGTMTKGPMANPTPGTMVNPPRPAVHPHGRWDVVEPRSVLGARPGRLR